ncbi:hypothetical protein EW146_g7184 [Bondarzewia mesenterica]|uniref:Uncharacterized protein n=1 Tax=Bondarzewia mesenterica TaxID=1095465 RepID=A0A4S4LS59_9AGAM|nr:hypothetical protein EW146_g7184 [Bondarzewia mesenterica]
MPEIRECYASANYLRHLFLVHKNTSDFRLRQLYYDATDKEQKRAKKISRISQGLVDELPAKSLNIKRGCKDAQTPLWPTTKSGPLPDLQLLELRDIHRTCRTGIFDFGIIWLQMQYLLHTSVQFYIRNDWEISISNVSKKDRNFRVGLALGFEDFVIAFLSRDLLVQAQWAASRDDLPQRLKHISILDDYQGFLTSVAQWIQYRRSSEDTERTGLVCDVLRSHGDIWGGVGVYTASEICFLAGISPLLQEREVFDCPSRCARLCEALYAFAAVSDDEIWPKLVKPCIRNGLLAPTVEDRLKYIQYLHVYAKDGSRISERMADLVMRYYNHLNNLTNNIASESSDLWDVFEPSYLQPYLLLEGHLGSLIFGQASWSAFSIERASSTASNPLSLFYAAEGLLTTDTHLDIQVYQPLFLSQSMMKRKIARPCVFQGQKQIWSLTPFISALYDVPNLKFLTEAERKKMTFRHIVANTREVAIGPLEYCGRAVAIKKRDGKGYYILACLGDPNPEIPADIANLSILMRQRQGMQTAGKSKGQMSNANRRTRKEELASAARAREHSVTSLETPTLDAVSPNISNKRRSADMAIVGQKDGFWDVRTFQATSTRGASDNSLALYSQKRRL